MTEYHLARKKSPMHHTKSLAKKKYIKIYKNKRPN